MKTITVSIVRNGDVYISHCLGYDIASQGSIKQMAVSSLLEVASPMEIQNRLKRSGQQD